MMSNLHIDFLATLVENTGKLNKASSTQKISEKTFILAAIVGKPTKVLKGDRNFSGNLK